MKNRTVYVKTFNNLNSLTKQYLYEGFHIIDQGTNNIVLKKNNFGNGWIHLILFVTTVLFFYGLVNVVYLFFSYFFLSEKLNLTIKNFDISNCNEEKFSSKNNIQSFLEDDEEVNFGADKNNSSSISPILTFLEKKK